MYIGAGRDVWSGNGGISGRWNEMMKTGGWFANILKKGS